MRLSLADITSRKQRHEKIVMLTAYDHPTARLLDKAGVDVILVGDSLANVVLGLPSTLDVGLDVMVHHARAVVRGVERAYVVGDMPFDAYQPAGVDAVAGARRLVDEAGCDGVKVEWFDGCVDVVRRLCQAGIEVMGHVGLTPQTVREFKVQGRDEAAARAILEQAKALEAAGCFAVVLECVPEALARPLQHYGPSSSDLR